MKLDAVQSAMQAKLEVEMRPVTDQLSRLRAALDAYEAVLRQDVERRVNNTILVALGQDPLPELEDLKRAQSFLLEAMSGMTVTIEPAPVSSAPEHVPVVAPATPKEIVPALPKTDRIQIAPTIPPSESFATLLTQGSQLASTRRQLRRIAPEDVTDAKRLLAEIEGLRKTFKTQHAARLSPLLQAIAAETRILLERLPDDHHYAEKLQEIIPTVGRLKHEGNVKDFIKGLAFNSSGSWASIAAASRRKVQQFDKDAETPPTSTKKPPPSAKKVAEAAPNAQYKWPELPNLRKLDKPILLAGGMFIPEKVTSIYERFGLKIEWHAIDHHNPKAQGPLLTRIRSQKLGAVVLLEGFMRHDAFKPIAEACSTSFVPMAYGDKAGIASLASAFDELEKKLAPRKEGAA